MIQRFTLRDRIVLTLMPLIVLLAALGSGGMWLLYQLGGRIDTILRENYLSVIAMQDLKEATERIDSSFQFMLIAKGLKDPDERSALESKAHAAFDDNWQSYDSALSKERDNVTIRPAEDELVARLSELTEQYRMQGRQFFLRTSAGNAEHQDYYGMHGLYETFSSIKKVADEILQLNYREMKKASTSASSLASSSLIWLSIGMVIAVGLAGLSAWQTMQTTLRPIRDIKEAAVGITGGNLDQVVPVFSRDELGELATAFNVMARHLREYRDSQSAHLLRAQKTGQATIDSFPDAIVVIDSVGRVAMANPAARKLLGVIPSGEGSPLGTWSPPPDLRTPLEEALLGVRDYLPESFDRILMLGENGRDRAFLPRILTIRDTHGGTLGAAVLLQDVTRLRLLDQMKTNLVATASHELKTPLTSIRLAVHLLLEETVGSLTPKQTELLLDARENSERLVSTVNDLLDLARLEEGSRQLDRQSISVATLLWGVADPVRVRATDKGIGLEVDVSPGLPEINVDVERIGHAISNLLDNAVTYTDAGGTIKLSAKRDAEFVVISVEDTGCGIPAESLPRIFEKFFRVPGQSRGSGTGLGLAIVREIVTAHGGTVETESQPSFGTTFRLRLPTMDYSSIQGLPTSPAS